jgi:hypothetical protein
MSAMPGGSTARAAGPEWQMGSTSRVVVSWTAGGAVFFGGFFAVGMALASRGDIVMSYGGDLVLSGVGALAGFVHGSALAVLGRRRGERAGAVAADIARAALLGIPLLLFALVLSPIIALGAAAIVMGLPLMMAAAAMAAAPAALMCGWAVVEGGKALKRAFDRWPEHRWGLPLVSVTLAALLLAFVARRPEIWFTQLRVTELGAVLLALGATLWLAVPVEAGSLHLLRRVRGGARHAAIGSNQVGASQR